MQKNAPLLQGVFINQKTGYKNQRCYQAL